MRGRINGTRVWVALTVATLALGALFPTQPSAALTKEQRQKALLSAVKILIVDADLKAFARCSGTHVGNGFIITNWHCVGQTDLYGPDDTGLGLRNGETYHPEGVVVIAPQKDPKQVPKPTYFARVVSGTPDLDIAIVKIFQMLDQKSKLPSTIPITTMTLGDSDKVDLGDPISIIGYPSAGGERVTYTEGRISGYEDQNEDGTPDSFKTDASINPGNSGGLAIDDAGNQIGIPTFGSNAGGGPGLGGVREINLAVPYLKQAQGVAAATPGANNKGNPGPLPTPGTGGGPFGPVVFGTEVRNGNVSNRGTNFPPGTKGVVGVFAFQGMKNGSKWGAVWQYNGKTVVDNRSKNKWDAGAKGSNGVQLTNSKGLPDGKYELALYVNNRQVQKGNFTVGQGDRPPDPQPPDPGDSGVVLQGRVVDADTERAVPGAVLVILKPGTALDAWDQSNDAAAQEMLAASAVADQNGNYVTVPGLSRGQTYTVIVAAANYERRVFEDALEIAADEPGVAEIEPISIQKR